MSNLSHYNITKFAKKVEETEKRKKINDARLKQIFSEDNSPFLKFNIKDDVVNEDAERILDTAKNVDTQNIDLLRRNNLYNEEVKISYQNLKNHSSNLYETVKSINVYTETILSNLDDRHNP